MTSTRPYLLRAIYDWIVDNGHTPHLLVEVGDDRVQVPRQHIENGVIVLNVSPSAVRDLELGNEFVMFSARFSGQAFAVSVPVETVQAIYSRENGQGIFLGEPDDEPDPDGPDDGPGDGQGGGAAPDGPKRYKAPHLKVVK